MEDIPLFQLTMRQYASVQHPNIQPRMDLLLDRQVDTRAIYQSALVPIRASRAILVSICRQVLLRTGRRRLRRILVPRQTTIEAFSITQEQPLTMAERRISGTFSLDRAHVVATDMAGMTLILVRRSARYNSNNNLVFFKEKRPHGSGHFSLVAPTRLGGGE